MNYIDRITELAPQVPAVVLEDVMNRIKDWVVSGGKEDDPYIEQQLKFVERVAAGVRNMTSEEIRNLQIDGVDVSFYDGYVTVQEGVVTGNLTWSLHVVDYGVSEFVATNQLRDVNIETEQGNVYAGEGLITKVTEEQFLLAGKSVLRGYETAAAWHVFRDSVIHSCLHENKNI